MNAGGGGGGGGWFGGGGGGADTDNCCADGGGGGGGSSYANPNYSFDIEHQAGVQLGNGFIRLTYQKQQSVVLFNAEQELDQIQFTLELVIEQVLGIEDFDSSAVRCQQLDLTTQQTAVLVTASGCEDGFHELGIDKSLIGGSQSGEMIYAGLHFDAIAPELSWELSTIDHPGNSAIIEYTLTEGILTPESLAVLGCSEIEVSESQIQLAACESEQVVLSVLAASLRDSFGNAGPESDQTLNMRFDLVAPEPSFSNLQVVPESGSHSVELTFSEPTSFDVSRTVLTGPNGCQFLGEEIETGYRLSASCGAGSYLYLIPANSAVDLAGNFGPPQDLVFELVVPEEVPASVLIPEQLEPIPANQGPEPTPVTAPSDFAEGPKETEPNQPVPISQDAPIDPVRIPTPVESPLPSLTDVTQTADVSESLSFEVDSRAGSEIEVPTLIPNPELETDSETFSAEPTDSGSAVVPVVSTSQETGIAQNGASPNLMLLALAGLALIGLGGYFGYRLIGR
jgi:hypothetical protein